MEVINNEIGLTAMINNGVGSSPHGSNTAVGGKGPLGEHQEVKE
jgi:hypothetical protein